MIIKNNIEALNVHKYLKFNNLEISNSLSRIASGERIIKSGDDPSGLAVSEKLRFQIASIKRAEQNTQDALSFIQTTESYLAGVSDVLQRIRELSVQVANGIYSLEDRQLVQIEVSQLVDEIDSISSQAEFNGLKILQGNLSLEEDTPAK